MKVTNLTLSAIALVGLTVAQNGNDPIILNNRTGLAPVVYDTFSTSYTKLPVSEPASNGSSRVVSVTVPVPPSAVRSNTYFPKPTTSAECWRNGYPCGQNGGQRSQRLVADFARTTPVSADDEVTAETGHVGFLNAASVPSPTVRRLGYVVPVAHIPPPEFSSSHPEVHVPGQTGDATMGILPIPAEFTDSTHYDAPPRSSSTRTDATDMPGETSEAMVSILPISTLPPSTEDSSAVIPSSWWRGHVQSYTIDCNRHYCPSQTGEMSTFSTTFSPVFSTTYPTIPPSEPYTTKCPAVPPKVTSAAVKARNAEVPINWWRNPIQPNEPRNAKYVPTE